MEYTDLVTLKEERIMEPKAPDLGLYSLGIAVIALITGWIGGLLRATWTMSKFESRVAALEKSSGELDEEDVASRVHDLEAIAEKLAMVPELVNEMRKTVNTIEKVVFQERGGLNIITLTEHDKMQAQCQAAFKKDLEIIRSLVEQVVKNSGVEELRRIEISIQRMENAMAARIRLDKIQHSGM